MDCRLRKDNNMQYSQITYSIQYPIYWNKLDKRKFISKEEAQNKFQNGEFYFCVFRNDLDQILAIIDYQGICVGVEIFEDGVFEGQAQKVPNSWSVYHVEPKQNYQNLIFFQYRYYNQHYNFRNGIVNMLITSDLLGHDKSYEGHYDEKIMKPLSITFDDYQTLFDDQAEIKKMVENIEFVEKVHRRK